MQYRECEGIGTVWQDSFSQSRLMVQNFRNAAKSMLMMTFITSSKPLVWLGFYEMPVHVHIMGFMGMEQNDHFAIYAQPLYHKSTCHVW